MRSSSASLLAQQLSGGASPALRPAPIARMNVAVAPLRHRAGPEKDANRCRWAVAIRGAGRDHRASCGRTDGAYPRGMAPVRNTLGALAGAARGAASLVVVIVVVAGMAWLLAGRGPTDGAGSIASVPPLVAAGPSAPGTSLSPSLEPSVAPTPGRTEPATQTVAPTATTTAEPALTPTPRPAATPAPATPSPTQKPAPKPTSAPTHDPAPEPTPRIWVVSGSFGQTLSVDGVQVRLDRREPSQDPLIQCGSREVVSYELRITWADPADAMEPWIAVGENPFNVLWFSPQGTFASGTDYIVSTCKRSTDTFKAMVELAPEDAPVRMQRFSFH